MLKLPKTNILRNNISKHRKRLCFTKSFVASMLNYSIPGYSNIEKCAPGDIKLSIALELCSLFQISFFELFGVTGDSDMLGKSITENIRLTKKIQDLSFEIHLLNQKEKHN